jgi:hypothetical protein
MKIDLERPIGCRAQAIAHIMPSTDYRSRETGEVMLICGDRKMDFPAEDSKPIKDPESYKYKLQELAQLASEVLCGFCVLCPNNLPSLEERASN